MIRLDPYGDVEPDQLLVVLRGGDGEVMVRTDRITKLPQSLCHLRDMGYVKFRRRERTKRHAVDNYYALTARGIARADEIIRLDARHT